MPGTRVAPGLRYTFKLPSRHGHGHEIVRALRERIDVARAHDVHTNETLYARASQGREVVEHARRRGRAARQGMDGTRAPHGWVVPTLWPGVAGEDERRDGVPFLVFSVIAGIVVEWFLGTNDAARAVSDWTFGLLVGRAIRN